MHLLQTPFNLFQFYISMKTVLVFLFVICSSTISHAQYVITKLWDKTLGGDKTESNVVNGDFGLQYSWNYHPTKIYSLPNGNILACGTSKSSISGDKTQFSWGSTDVWLVLIDSTSGQKLADYRFGGTNEDQFVDFDILPNGNYFLTITSGTYNSSGDYSVAFNGVSQGPRVRYLLLDSAFNKIWDRVIQGDSFNRGTRMIWRNNMYYLLFYGVNLNSCELNDTICDGENAYTNQIGLGVYDSSGTIVWDHLYGAGSVFTGNEVIDDLSYDILPCADNKYFLTGRAYDTHLGCTNSDSSAGYYDISIYNIDSIGNVLWHRCYGGAGNDLTASKLLPTNDGNFFFAAISNSPQSGEVSQLNPVIPIATGFGDSSSLWIVKFDPQGTVIWDKRYGSCHYVQFATAIKTQDGGFLIGVTIGGANVAISIDSVPGCDVTEYGRGLADYWVLKLDSAGNKEWDKRWGGSERDGLTDLAQLTDGSYLALGISYSSVSGDKTEPNRDTSHINFGGTITPATMDYWVVRFRADKVIGLGEFYEQINLKIMPNPSNDICHINAANITNATLTLYDITGRKMMQQEFNEHALINLALLSSGVYIVELQNEKGRSVKGKLVKE